MNADRLIAASSDRSFRVTRVRGESNSFNVLRIERPQIDVSCYSWDPERLVFVPGSPEHFLHTPTGWARARRAADSLRDA